MEELSVQHETVGAGFDVPISYAGSLSRSAKPILLLVAEPAAVYRPRHPEQTAFYQLFDKHFDDNVYAHEERFETKAGFIRDWTGHRILIRRWLSRSRWAAGLWPFLC